jgi:hypothetical protein
LEKSQDIKAHSVEPLSEKQGVGSSILPLATMIENFIKIKEKILTGTFLEYLLWKSGILKN